MNNPAEEIVSTWIQFCKNQFVMTNIPYQYRTETGKSVTREIDILATDGPTSFADYEVKWRTTSWINATKSETIEAIAEQLGNKDRIEAIKKIISSVSEVKNPKIRRILVTPKKHFGKDTLAQREKELNKLGVEIVWFEMIINDLITFIEKSPNKGQFDSPVLGAIRIFREIES